MSSMRWMAALAAGLTLTGLGCGSEDDPVSTQQQYQFPDYPSFCVAHAEAECSESVQDRCATTAADCKAARARVCNESFVTVQYRPQEAEKCLDAVRAAYSDDEITQAEHERIDADCELVRGGTKGKGATCTSTQDCNLDDGLRCVKPTAAAEGQCHVPEEVAVGESCSTAGAVCATGTFCTTGDNNYCVKQLPLGSSCPADVACEEGLRCVPAADETQPGTCQKKLDVGQPCTSGDECAYGFCMQVGSATQCVKSIIFSPNEPICAEFR